MSPGARAIVILALAFPSLAATGPAGGSDGAGARADRSFLVRGARIFDGEGVIARGDVLVEDGTITRVAAGIEPPAGTAVIDGAGRTLLPGLIDAHTHAYAESMLAQALMFGVTTELDMFTSLSFAARMRREERNDLAAFLSAGTLVTAPGGHGTQYGLPVPTLRRASEAAAFVAARVAEGSDYIKIVYDRRRAAGGGRPTLDRATMTAAVTAAHAHGKLAVVHVLDRAAAREAIAAGADGLAHLWVDAPLEPELLEAIRRRGVFVIPTTTVIASLHGRADPEGLLTDEHLAAFLSASDARALSRSFPDVTGLREDGLEIVLGTILALYEAGVPLLAGTDAPNPGTVHGASLHRELELLVRAGLPPTAALATATSAAADAFALADRGRIRPGLRADLVLVTGDPTTDITATRAITHVWKRGVALDREGYREGVEAAKRRSGETSKSQNVKKSKQEPE